MSDPSVLDGVTDDLGVGDDSFECPYEDCPECGDGQPATFGSMDEWTDHMRQAHGVDGPL